MKKKICINIFQNFPVIETKEKKKIFFGAET